MKRPKSYNTKQREAILDYIASLDGSHVTAAQIVSYFGNTDSSIGRTTVYRLLDKLEESGEVRRYSIDGMSGACFQYVDHRADCDEHFHLKCEYCGELFHLQCDELNKIQQHILIEHAFQVNALKTVLYGTCDNCLKEIY